ncbi:PKD domain-containing protein [Thermosulfurimonas dismutans]|uniref:PKD domain-containing protein n=1 Tax=Thermosulfurimonas dismutans TaxID=999894 RepID=A0A179D176_9BACT|nr:PKD domain-containing protein [Thermosulfurimonas dismutans]OAQ19816.1 hypothetical protein TDIS_2091 [Thermosulfurimonas dismutans]
MKKVRVKKFLAFLGLLLLIASCGGGGGGGKESSSAVSFGTRGFGEVTVSGQVRYAEGVLVNATLEGISVDLLVDMDRDGEYDPEAGDKVYSALTDAGGYFRFYGVRVPLEGTRGLIEVQAPGFIPYAKEYSLYPGASLSISDIELEPAPSVTISLNETTRAAGPIWVVYGEDGSLRTYRGVRAPGAITANGSLVAVRIDPAEVPDNVTSLTVTLRGFDSSDPQDIRYFPGDFRGEDPNHKLPEVALESVMFSYLDLRDQDGNPVTLKQRGGTRQTDDPCWGDIYIYLTPGALDKVNLLGDADRNTPGCQTPLYRFPSGNATGGWEYRGTLTLCKVNPDGTLTPAECSETASGGSAVMVFRGPKEGVWWNLDYVAASIFGAWPSPYPYEDCNIWKAEAAKGDIVSYDLYYRNCVKPVISEGGGGETGGGEAPEDVQGIPYVPVLEYRFLFRIGLPGILIKAEGQGISAGNFTDEKGKTLLKLQEPLLVQKDYSFNCTAAKNFIERKKVKFYAMFPRIGLLPLDPSEFREPTKEERENYDWLSCVYEFSLAENTTSVVVLARSAAGDVLSGKRVCISDNKFFLKCKETNEEGEAVFENIPPGSYRFFGEHLRATNSIVEVGGENRVVLQEGNNPPEVSFTLGREQIPGTVWSIDRDVVMAVIIRAEDPDGDPLRIVSVRCPQGVISFDNQVYNGTISRASHARCRFHPAANETSWWTEVTVTDGYDNVTLKRDFSIIHISYKKPRFLGYQLKPPESGTFYKDPYEEIYYNGTYLLRIMALDTTKVSLDNTNCTRKGSFSFECVFPPGDQVVNGTLTGPAVLPFQFTLHFTDNFSPHILRLSLPQTRITDNDTLTAYLTLYDAESDNLTIRVFHEENLLKEASCRPKNQICNFLLQLPPEVLPAGNNTFTLKVTDGRKGHEDERSFRVYIESTRPYFTRPLPSETIRLGAGEKYTFTVEAVDPNGDPLSYTWYVNGKVVASGTPSLTYTFTEPGVYTVEVRVSDGTSVVSSVSHVTVEGGGGITGLTLSTGFEGIYVTLLDENFRPVETRRTDENGTVSFDYVTSSVNLAFHLDTRNIVVPEWFAFAWRLWEQWSYESSYPAWYMWDALLNKRCVEAALFGLPDFNGDGVSTPEEIYQDYLNRYPEDGGKLYLYRLSYLGFKEAATVVVSGVKPGSHDVRDFIRNEILDLIGGGGCCRLDGWKFSGSTTDFMMRSFFRTAQLGGGRILHLLKNFSGTLSLGGYSGFIGLPYEPMNEFGALYNDNSTLYLSTGVPLVLLSGNPGVFWLHLSANDTYHLNSEGFLSSLTYNGTFSYSGNPRDDFRNHRFEVFSLFEGNMYNLGYEESYQGFTDNDGRLTARVTLVPPFTGDSAARVLVRYHLDNGTFNYYVDRILTPEQFLSDLEAGKFLYLTRLSDFSSRMLSLSVHAESEGQEVVFGGNDASQLDDIFVEKSFIAPNSSYTLRYYGPPPESGTLGLDPWEILPEDLYQRIFETVTNATEVKVGPLEARKCNFYDPQNGIEPYAEECSWFLASSLWKRTCTQRTDFFSGLSPESLVVDRDGSPHAVYYRGSLYHLWKDDTGWHTEVLEEGIRDGLKVADIGPHLSLVSDSEGRLHVAYVVNGTLRHAWWEGSAWQKEDVGQGVDVQGYISLAVDSQGGLHLVYTDTSGNLKYAYRAASGWQTQVVDGNGSSAYPSLVLDDSDRPHLVYYRTSERAILYAFREGGEWRTQTVANGTEIRAEHSLLSLALDANGTPGVVYSVPASGQLYPACLKYNYFNGTSWEVDNVTCRAVYPSLGFDSANRPFVVYYDPVTAAVYFARFENGTWSTEGISETGIGDLYETTIPSLALDENGTVHVLYYRKVQEDLEYAFRSASGWQRETALSLPERYSYKNCTEWGVK